MTVGQQCLQVERVSHTKVLSEMIVQMLDTILQYYHLKGNAVTKIYFDFRRNGLGR